MKDDDWTEQERASNRIGLALLLGGLALIFLTHDSANTRRYRQHQQERTDANSGA